MAATASFHSICHFFCDNKIESPRHRLPFFTPLKAAAPPNSSMRITADGRHHKIRRPFVAVAALENDQSKQQSPSESPSLHEATIDLQLPRRSLLVKFTCNTCGERTERLVNRLAYERGTVFVQCAGCLQHHKLVDNLGLVVEYDLREDMDSDLSADLG